jgi:probable HAF family extracellular repeat protein
MQDLGTLGGDRSGAAGINDAGQIAGSADTATGDLHAFLYSSGHMQDLGILGGTTGWSPSWADGINAAGQVVGLSSLSNGGFTAFLYSGGQMQDFSAGSFDEAYAINNVGQIVGQGPSTAYPTEHAVLYSGGKTQDLGPPTGYGSQALGVNDAGQVVGWFYNGIATHAFLYSGGQMKDLGTLGATNSDAEGINNAGQVVGSVNSSTTFRAFLYSNGTMIDLNTLIDPSSGWTLQDATAINDQGQIVGFGINSAMQGDGFLLTPTPEPATLSLLTLGGVAMLRRKRGPYGSRRREA